MAHGLDLGCHERDKNGLDLFSLNPHHITLPFNSPAFNPPKKGTERNLGSLIEKNESEKRMEKGLPHPEDDASLLVYELMRIQQKRV